MPQTKAQLSYGIRRTWANKLQRLARAVRYGQYDEIERLEKDLDKWLMEKYNMLTRNKLLR